MRNWLILNQETAINQPKQTLLGDVCRKVWLPFRSMNFNLQTYTILLDTFRCEWKTSENNQRHIICCFSSFFFVNSSESHSSEYDILTECYWKHVWFLKATWMMPPRKKKHTIRKPPANWSRQTLPIVCSLWSCLPRTHRSLAFWCLK